MGCKKPATGSRLRLRLGYFPNITHAQPIIGLARGTFKEYLGKEMDLTVKVFSAGPAAIEAFLAGELDVAYVGPSPAITGYIRTGGRELRVISGAASGGAVFVTRQDVQLKNKEDYFGKRFASPQIGNSQDISLRIYLKRLGYEPKEKGGTVEILPIANADILTLFLRKEIDAAWVPEPWGSILVNNGNGRIQLDERDLWPNRKFATTIVVASKKLLEGQPDLVRKWLRAHVKVTQWIQQNPMEAKRILNQEIARLTRKPIPETILDEAFSRIELTWDPILPSLQAFFERSLELKYLKGGDIGNIADLSILNEVLREAGSPVLSSP